MCSDACVSDFDSDESVWPCHEDSCSFHSVSTVELQPSRCSSRHVYEFGEFEDTYGWVQCQSKSQRGRLYFHNIHSGCNTWYQPISRYANIPLISLEKMICTDNLTMSDLELMSVSDDEEEQKLPVTARDRDRSPMKTQLNTLARWYGVPRMNSTSDTKDSFSESNKYYDEIDANGNDYGDNNEDSETKFPQFCIEDFLETEIGKGKANTENPKIEDDNDNTSISSASTILISPRRTVFATPRLKKIGFEEQIIKWQDARSFKDQGGPRKIICEMHGIKTISYDLPNPDEVRPQVGVKTTRLTDSDSDDGDGNGSPPSLRSDMIKKTLSSYRHSDWISNWDDFTKDLQQPLLSDASTSSDTSTCSTCSTCSTHSTSSE